MLAILINLWLYPFGYVLIHLITPMLLFSGLTMIDLEAVLQDQSI
jgi:hypothetical protein